MIHVLTHLIVLNLWTAALPVFRVIQVRVMFAQNLRPVTVPVFGMTSAEEMPPGMAAPSVRAEHVKLLPAELPVLKILNVPEPKTDVLFVWAGYVKLLLPVVPLVPPKPIVQIPRMDAANAWKAHARTTATTCVNATELLQK